MLFEIISFFDILGVAVEIVAAVVAMLHLALMPVDKERLCLLPAAETAVILSLSAPFFSFLSLCRETQGAGTIKPHSVSR